MTLARKRTPSYANVVASNSTSTTQESSQSLKGNVKVIVRIRPENEKELNRSSKCVVKTVNEHILVFDPKEEIIPEYGYRNRHRQHRDLNKRRCKDLKFAFDYVYGPESLNSEIYQTSTKQILEGLLDGYNCSVFAYGATGAGKTHTMLGNPQQPGVIYLTMVELFARMKAMEAEKTCDVTVSYLEVYNEKIRDLMVKGSFLPVWETPDSRVKIQGLSVHKPKTAEELLHMLHYGNENRTQHPTDANAESSRSHAVFQVFVRQKDRTANISAEMRVAKMCLVDLAGSERAAAVSKNSRTRFREGTNINKSLLALGNVINALADSKYKGYIPYRNSKLTRLLKDSLGGNCQTIMIAAVSPSSLSYEDTYNTLKYADRAKHIQALLKKNVMNVDFHVTRYGKIVEELRQEIVELKAKVQLYEVTKRNGATTQQLVNPVITRMRNEVKTVYDIRLGLCREVLDSELKTRDLKWKIIRKERRLSRMSVFCEVSPGTKGRMLQAISASHQRCKTLQKGKEETKSNRLRNNTEHLEQLKTSIEKQNQESNVGAEAMEYVHPLLHFLQKQERGVLALNLSQQLHATSLSLTQSEYCIKYLSKVIKAQEREVISSERLIIQLLQIVKLQHAVLKGNNLVTSDIDCNYKKIQMMINGREVSFADQNDSVLDSNGISVSDILDFKSLSTDVSNLTSSSSTSQQTAGPLTDVLYTNNHEVAGPKRVMVNMMPSNPSRIVNSFISDSVIDKNPQTKNKRTSTHSFSDSGVTKESEIQTLNGGENSLNKQTTAGHTPFGKIELVNKQSDSEILSKNDSHLGSLSGIEIGQIVYSNQTLSNPDTSYSLNEQSQRGPDCQCKVFVVPRADKDSNVKQVKTFSEQVKSTHSDMRGTCSGNTYGQCMENNQIRVCDPPGGQVLRNPVIKACTDATFTLDKSPSVWSKTPVIESQGRQYTKCDAIVNSQICTYVSNPITRDDACPLKSQSIHNNSINKDKVSSQQVGILQSTTTIIQNPQPAVIKSQTVTKENPMNENFNAKVSSKSNCVRSLIFEGTPNRGRSYAEVAASPLAEMGRKPLCHLNVNMTPSASIIMQASPKTSEGKENCPVSKDRSSKPTFTSKIWDQESQRNAKKLQRMGLLSLTDRSKKNLIASDHQKSVTPGYMKMTKSANHRTKLHSRLYKRSQSVTDLQRPGWQH